LVSIDPFVSIAIALMDARGCESLSADAIVFVGGDRLLHTRGEAGRCGRDHCQGRAQDGSHLEVANYMDAGRDSLATYDGLGLADSPAKRGQRAS
jgi:hypothetical protein